ncbi:uncharacterized protein LOC128396113 [Panonychus citri]|uniref:uncharacterized protein LOC128396113 n=1 Tax=Panonychus citri TaxID=50023 RepID=UPI002307E4FC|nr:uncharacterized protein LOC128396113 [Panonychus citri]
MSQDISRLNGKVEGLQYAFDSQTKNLVKKVEEIAVQSQTVTHTVNHAPDKDTEQSKSYASVAKLIQQEKKDFTQTIVIKKKGVTDPKILREQFLARINPSEARMHIDNIRMTFDNPALVIRTASPFTASLIANESKNGFETKIIKKRRPLMIIKNVARDIDKSTIITSLANQNSFSPDEMKLKFETGNKHSNACDLVIETSHELRRKLLKDGCIYIHYSRCRVEDFFKLVKCYKCQGYGHISKYCKRDEICIHCSEKHATKLCPNLDKPPLCINCKRSTRDAKHKSTDPCCPMRLIAMKHQIQAYNYSGHTPE